MNEISAMCGLMSRYHSRMGDAFSRLKEDVEFYIFFGTDGVEVPFDVVFAASHKSTIGVIEACLPTRGVGYNSHLRYLGGPSRHQHRYEFVCPFGTAEILVTDMGSSRVAVSYTPNPIPIGILAEIEKII